MDKIDYIKKLEDLKQKNISKIDNFKSISNQIEINIESIQSEILKLETEVEFIKNIVSGVKNSFFELCVSIKI
jgi:hypothetical protein